MVNVLQYPISVTKDGVETRLDTIASWVETKDGVVTGLSDQIGSAVEVAGRTGSLYLRGRHREEKRVVLKLWVNNTDADGLTPSYTQFRKNVDTINRLFDTTNSQIVLTEYLGGTFGSGNTLSRTNLQPNPDFKSAGATVVVRTNYSINPSGVNSVSGWGVWNGNGTGAAANLTQETGVGANGNAGFLRGTWTTAPASGGGLTHGYFAVPLSATVIATSGWVRCSVASSVYLNIQPMRSSDKTYPAGAQGAFVSVPANTWTRISTIMSNFPADCDSCQLRFYVNGSTLVQGSTLDVDDVLVETLPLVGSYFDGSTTTGFDKNLVASWSGATGTSTSVAKGASVTDWTTLSTQAASWQAEDGSSVYIRNISNAAWGLNSAPFYTAGVIPASPGVPISASLRVLESQPFHISLQSYGTGTMTGSTFGADASNGQTTSVNNYIPPAGATGVRLIMRSPTGVPVGTTLRVDQAIVEQAPAVGDYFDGDTNGARWNGTAQRSSSTLTSPGARSALVEVRSKYEPDYDPTFEHAQFTIECVINSGVWSDTGTTQFVSPSGTATSTVGQTLVLSPFVGGTTEIEDAYIVVEGPINSPKITDLTNGSVLQLQTNLPAGLQWIINCATYETKVGTNIENTTNGVSVSQYTFASGPLSPSLFPIHPNAIIRLDGTGAGTTTRIKITASRKYH